MIRLKRFLIPVIIIYVLTAAVLVVTAINPGIDYSVSQAMTGGASSDFAFANTLEIWIEPVPLFPMCFILSMGAVYALKVKGSSVPVKILSAASMIAGSVLAYQIFERIVKYYVKVKDISLPWIVSNNHDASVPVWAKLICAAAGVGLMLLFAFFAKKTDAEVLKKTGRVILFCAISLLVELAAIELLKNVFCRIRYREWIFTYGGYQPWYRINAFELKKAGIPVTDGLKSFPSGHTANNFLLITPTFMFDAVGKRKTGDILRICVLIWECFVMAARIMAGAHYLSDVAAGLLISLTIVLVTGLILFKEKRAKEN